MSPAATLAHHDGATYHRQRDHGRLNQQLRDVFQLMRDGGWHTLGEIMRRTGHPEASVSARIRDLRKPQFGGHTVERQHVSGGLHQYRLSPKPSQLVDVDQALKAVWLT